MSPKQAVFTVDLEMPYEPVEHGAQAYISLFRETGIRATFFASGDVVEHHPAIIEAVLSENHEVACHGWRHPYPTLPYTERPPLLTDVPTPQLEDEFGRAVDLLNKIGVAPKGFRAMWYRIDARVLESVARFFDYDSSLSAKTLAGMTLPDGLRELPVSTFPGTNIKIGTPIMFGPGFPWSLAASWSAAAQPPLVCYGHSFDFFPFREKLYNSRVKQFWYYHRCGPHQVRRMATFINTLQKKGYTFSTGLEVTLEDKR